MQSHQIFIIDRNVYAFIWKAFNVKSPEGDFNENNSENVTSGPGQDSGQEPPSGSVIEELVDNRNVDHRIIDTISNSNNTNTNTNTNDNIIAAATSNEYNNNYKDNLCSNLTNPSPLPRINLPVVSNRQTSQIELSSNKPYRHLKCDACDASDATDTTSRKTEINHKAKTKAEEVGLLEIPCIYCDFKDPIAFDLSLHYIEKHRYQLIRLPLGKASIDDRADYAIELSKKKLLESFEDEDENDNNDIYEIEEDE